MGEDRPRQGAEPGGAGLSRHDSFPPPQGRRSEAFWGRRQGKPLRPQMAQAVARTLPGYLLDLSRPAPADLRHLFSVAVVDVRLEIGFGGGEHLRHEAARFPETGFLGVEPFNNGMAKMAAALEAEPLANLRLFDEDATLLLDWLPARSLCRVDLLYPDPWPKRRHWKRRFVGPRNLDRLAGAVMPGGEFRFASDVADYVNWTLQSLRRHPAFIWTARDADDWRTPWEGWPGTRYEAKALREGRVPAYLAFRRRED